MKIFMLLIRQFCFLLLLFFWSGWGSNICMPKNVEKCRTNFLQRSKSNLNKNLIQPNRYKILDNVFYDESNKENEMNICISTFNCILHSVKIITNFAAVAMIKVQILVREARNLNADFLGR